MAWFDDLKTPRINKTQLNQDRVSKVPEGLWKKCESCGEVTQNKALKDNAMVCPECDYHHRLSGWDRVALLCDQTCVPDSKDVEIHFEPYGSDLYSKDPLKFDDRKSYAVRLKQAAEKTGFKDAFVAGKAFLGGLPYHLGAFDFSFMGGSMGVVVGEKIALVFENALKDQLPAVVVSASGGARMQEGILSLMQMAKTSALVQDLRENGIPYISILADPTTGGVAASFAMLGDIIIAEPKALIGFAGPRVIQQTIRQKLPEGFQRSEFLLEHGFIDRIVNRKELAGELREWMLRLGKNTCRFPKKLG